MPIKVLGKLRSSLHNPKICCPFCSAVCYCCRQSAKSQRSCNDLECKS